MPPAWALEILACSSMPSPTRRCRAYGQVVPLPREQAKIPPPFQKPNRLLVAALFSQLDGVKIQAPQELQPMVADVPGLLQGVVINHQVFLLNSKRDMIANFRDCSRDYWRSLFRI